MTVSLIGDGIFLIAIAWTAFKLWNAPAALSVIGIAMTVPTIVCLLAGGAVSDRFDRRLVLVASDLARAAAVALLAGLAMADSLTFPLLAVLAAAYSAAGAFFTPAFEAIVPSVVAEDDLAAANSLDQFVRPLALRLVGPALGGLLVAQFGFAVAFAIDAASFAASTAAILALRTSLQPGGRSGSTARRDPRRLRLRPPPRLALGDFDLSDDRLPRFPRPDRGARPLSGEERASRFGAGPRHRLCRRRHRRHCSSRPHGPAWPASSRPDGHVRVLDRGDAHCRGLRPGALDCPARACLPRLQRPRSSRHDRLGDHQAVAGADGAFWDASRVSTG